MDRSEPVFVAGADTLIGGGVINALRRDGYDVLDGMGDADLRQPASVEAFLSRHRPRTVVIAAGKHAGITGNQRYPADLIYDNLLIVTHVIHQAWAHGTTRLLYLASSCTYPKLAPQPMQVTSLLTGPLEPTNKSYAVAKLAGIQMCEAYSRQYGVHFFAGVPADAFGPGDDFSPEDSHVVAGLMRRMHAAKLAGAATIDIWGSGTQRREFIYMDDLGGAVLHALTHYRGAGPINLGGGRDASIAELAMQIRDVVGFEGELRFDTSKPDGMPFKALDSSELLGMGWRPSVDFETALRRTYAWFVQGSGVPADGVPARTAAGAERVSA